jgi:glycosyltransferase involved in cell wall biosynthesis
MTAGSPDLVSVVIACYNQGRFLGDAIESALAQTYAPVQVIVVDDGSTDRTSQVASAYPVKCLRQRNAGAPAARNNGFRESRGRFVLFLDADDRLLPEAIATGCDALAAHPDWAFATGHVRLIGGDGAAESTPPQDHAGGDQFLALLRSNYIWTPGAVLYRRDVLDSGGPFDPSAKASADYELNLRLARRHPVGCHHQVVLEYRRHESNMSGDAGDMLRSAMAVRLRQRRVVAGNAAAERSWQEGIAIVRSDFGERLLRQVKGDLRRPGRWPRAALGLARLARYYPAGLWRAVAAGARSPASA